jgi:hypothetical protein
MVFRFQEALVSDWISVVDRLPVDVEDKEIQFEDGTTAFGYLAPGGEWCGGLPIPFNKKVVAWKEYGGFGSLQEAVKDQ